MIVEAAPAPSIVTETPTVRECSKYLPEATSITSLAAASDTAWPTVAHGDDAKAQSLETSEPLVATYRTWVPPKAGAADITDIGTTSEAITPADVTARRSLARRTPIHLHAGFGPSLSIIIPLIVQPT